MEERIGYIITSGESLLRQVEVREGGRERRREGGAIKWLSTILAVRLQVAPALCSSSLPPSLPPSSRIVDDILELFRLSSNRLQIDESVVDIHSYFMTLCDLVQVITDKNQRRLERVLDPSLPR